MNLNEKPMDEIVIPKIQTTDVPVNYREVYGQIIERIPDGKALLLEYPSAEEVVLGRRRITAVATLGNYGRMSVCTKRLGDRTLLVWRKYGPQPTTVVHERYSSEKPSH